MCHGHSLARAASTALGAWGHWGALVHPKRWHFSSRTVPPGPTTLWGFIPHAGMQHLEQNQASRGKSYLEKIPAPRELPWWEDSSLHKGSQKLQPLLRALSQPAPVPCCPPELGLEPAQGLSPALTHGPAKLVFTGQGFAQASPLGILPLLMLSLQEIQKFLSVACITIFPGDHFNGFPILVVP